MKVPEQLSNLVLIKKTFVGLEFRSKPQTGFLLFRAKLCRKRSARVLNLKPDRLTSARFDECKFNCVFQQKCDIMLEIFKRALLNRRSISRLVIGVAKSLENKRKPKDPGCNS